MRIGFDVDGVLADFNSSFIALVKEVSGRDLFPPDYWPHTWDYPQALGYSQEEVKAVWDHIKQGGSFWFMLNPLDDAIVLRDWMLESNPQLGVFDEFYFITSRMGKNVKFQTENWLDAHVASGLTVLISSEKGALCKALKLDYYVDDRAENVKDVELTSPNTFAYLIEQPWNQHLYVSRRIPGLSDFLQIIDAHTDAEQSKTAA